MSRNTQQRISTPVILLLLGALLIATVFLVPAGFNVIEGGMTVNSVSAPNVVGNEELSRLNWLVETTLATGSDRIRFSLSPAQIKAESGVASERTFTVSATNVEETVIYDIIRNPNQPLYTYGLSTKFTTEPDCPEALFVLSVPDGRTWYGAPKTAYYCLYRELYARTGIYDLQSTQFSADLLVSNGQDTIPRTISSRGPLTVSFAERDGTVVTATWTGSLVTGNTPPSLNQYTAVLRQSSVSVWEPVQATLVNEYVGEMNRVQSELNRLPGELTGEQALSFLTSIQEDISDLNRVRSRTIDQPSSLGTGFTLKNGKVQDGATLVFDTDSTFANPRITWWIRADWLGVERTAGMPGNIRIGDVSFGSSAIGYVPISVENVGNGRGTFTATLESCPGITMTSTPTRVTLNPGGRGTIGFSIDNGINNAVIDSRCTVRVYDVALPENDATARFNVEYRPDQLCTPDSYIADGTENAIYRCSSDGLTRTLVTTCAGGTRVTNTGQGPYDGYECVSTTNPDIVVPPPPVEGEGRFSLTLLIVTLVLSTAGGVYAWNATRKFNRWVGVSLGIIAFVGVFFLVPAFVNGIISMFTLNIPGWAQFSVIP